MSTNENEDAEQQASIQATYSKIEFAVIDARRLHAYVVALNACANDPNDPRLTWDGPRTEQIPAFPFLRDATIMYSKDIITYARSNALTALSEQIKAIRQFLDYIDLCVQKEIEEPPTPTP